MERKKLFVRIGIGAAGVLLLAALAFAVRAVGEYNVMRQGFQEGFPLRGTYQGDPQQGGIGTIAFQTFDGERSWAASSGPGASAEGVFKDTVDPNCYLLEDADGNEVGWVHLAYTDENENRVVLYVRYGSDDLVEMRKVDSVPSYVHYD